MRKVFSIPGAPAPIGPYSQAVMVNDTLYLSGQIPLNPHTNELVVDNIESATKRVMENIKALIDVAGMDMSNIVKVSIFIKDMNDFSKINAVYATYFEDVFPARETVQVAELPLQMPIEISCIAIKD